MKQSHERTNQKENIDLYILCMLFVEILSKYSIWKNRFDYIHEVLLRKNLKAEFS